MHTCNSSVVLFAVDEEPPIIQEGRAGEHVVGIWSCSGAGRGESPQLKHWKGQVTTIHHQLGGTVSTGLVCLSVCCCWHLQALSKKRGIQSCNVSLHKLPSVQVKHRSLGLLSEAWPYMGCNCFDWLTHTSSLYHFITYCSTGWRRKALLTRNYNTRRSLQMAKSRRLRSSSQLVKTPSSRWEWHLKHHSTHCVLW